MSRTEAKKIAKKYAQLLSERNVLFYHLYLFGSYVTGRPRAESDIDIAVVANKADFKRGYLQKKIQLWSLAAEIDSRIEPVLLSTEEMSPHGLSAIGSAVRQQGIKIV